MKNYKGVSCKSLPLAVHMSLHCLWNSTGIPAPFETFFWFALRRGPILGAVGLHAFCLPSLHTWIGPNSEHFPFTTSVRGSKSQEAEITAMLGEADSELLDLVKEAGAFLATSFLWLWGNWGNLEANQNWAFQSQRNQVLNCLTIEIQSSFASIHRTVQI